MRLLLTILFFISLSASGTNYYVSNTGSDGAAGTSTGTAWQTISKVNSSSFSPGDSILFKCGDSWNEMLTVPSSGSVGNPIIFSSYGTGAKPLITGFQSLSMSDAGGNIWTATATNAVKVLNTVLINGKLGVKARYPNSGSIDNLTHSGDTLITTELTGTPDYTGAEVVVRTYRWIWDKTLIRSQNVDTLIFRPITYPPNDHFGFFIQNSISALDSASEFVIDSTTKLLSVYATSSPTVYISTIDTLFFLNNKSYIDIVGLQFSGANINAIKVNAGSNVNITSCTVNNTGTNGIDVYNSHYCSATYDTVMNSLNNGVNFRTLNNSNIQFNYVKNSGIYAGMGSSGEGMYNGIYNGGDDSLGIVSNNRVDSSGYNGLMVFQYHGRIERNYITTFCFVKDDGGGIYGGWDSTVIRNNIISGGIGAPYYGTYNICGNNCISFITPGIYMDGTNYYCIIDSNTISDCNQISLFSASGHDNIFKNNTVVSNNLTNGTNFSSNENTPITSIKNILYEKNTATSFAVKNRVADNIDSNVYIRFVDNYYVNKFQVDGGLYRFEPYKSLTGHDTNATDTLINITSTTGVLYINPTLNDSTITLSGNYTDAFTNLYFGTVTISPYQSKLLWPSTAESPPLPPNVRGYRFKFKKVTQ